jgi:hypothetical protein
MQAFSKDGYSRRVALRGDPFFSCVPSGSMGFGPATAVAIRWHFPLSESVQLQPPRVPPASLLSP